MPASALRAIESPLDEVQPVLSKMELTVHKKGGRTNTPRATALSVAVFRSDLTEGSSHAANSAGSGLNDRPLLPTQSLYLSTEVRYPRQSIPRAEGVASWWDISAKSYAIL